MLYHNPTPNFYHLHQAKDAAQDIDAAPSSSSYYHTAENPKCNYDGCHHDDERGCGHECEPEYSEYDTDSTLDKIQWQAWFDEVRSSIIYAGLLSAIVTPFIIESNKKLKPNPDEIIASLLAQIVSSSSLSPQYASSDSDTHIPPRTIPPATTPPYSFTPNPAHVRANTFWLISLILSVAVILVGSFVIQWLRVCRSYSLPSFSVASGSGTGNQSPLSPLFKLNFESKFVTPPTSPITPMPTMRRAGQGPEKWHLRMALATLPLFLQLAVVLFLGGLMDFVQVFGDCAVLVSVSVVVVFALYIWRVGGMQ